MERSIYILIIFCGLAVKDSHSNGHVGITLVQFLNSLGLDSAGECCDGVNFVNEGCPTGKCDHELSFCMSQLDGTGVKCKIFVGPPDNNEIIFTDKDEFLYSFDRWQGGVIITINVTDVDTDKSDQVDLYNITLTQSHISTSLEQSKFEVLHFNGSRDASATSIELKVRSYCDRYFYGDCSVKCIDNNECDGHYTCGDQGQKICRSGWKGSECNEIISGSEKDCSVYSGSIFEIGKWSGHLHCNGPEGEIILHVTEVATSAKELSGTVMIGGLTASVEGHYNDIGIQLNSMASVIGTKFNLSVFDISFVRKNSSYLEGSIKFRDFGNHCDLDLYRMSDDDDVLNTCEGRGTCVRYGAARSHTYCCCFDGTEGKTCRSATAKPTLITSITNKSTLSMSSVTPTTNVRSTPSPSSTTTAQQSSAGTQSQNTSTAAVITTQGSTPTSQQKASSSSLSSIEQSPTTPQEKSTMESTTQPIITTHISESTTASTQPIATSPAIVIYTTDVDTVETKSTQSIASSTEAATEHTTSSTQSTTITSTQSTTMTSTTTEITTLPSTAIASTSESIIASTTETPKPFIPNKTYKLMLEAAPEELNDDDDNLENLISEAYFEANIDVLEKNIISTNVTEKRNAIGDDGALVIEVTYTLTINSTKINFTNVHQPTTLQWTSVLHREYQISVYIGVNIWYLEETISIYATGRPPMYQKYEELAGYIKEIWNINSNLAKGTINITVLTTEEYVGEKGEEVYRLYYIVTNGTSVYHPDVISVPSMSELKNIFKLHTGLRWRYRFSYGVIFYDSIKQTELTELASVMQAVWYGVTILNVTVKPIRTERYMGKEGEFLVKFLYFVSRGSRVISPVQWRGPTTNNFKAWMETVEVNKRYLRVYTSDVNYRYIYHTGIYIQDRVDRRDWKNISTQLEMTWSSLIIDWKESGFGIKIVAVIDYTTNSSEVVQLLTYYIYKGSFIVDASSLEKYYTVNKHIIPNLNVQKTNGELYEVVTQRQFVELRTQFSFYVEGIITKTDIAYFEQSLVSVWNRTQGYIGKDLSVKIHFIEETIDVKSEMLVSKLYYSLMVAKQTVDAYSVDVSKNFSYNLEQTMIIYMKYQTYKLYQYTSALVERRFSYSLYFNTKMTRLDFSAIQTRLKLVLAKYLGLTYEFEIIIGGQEEFYTVFDRKSFQMSTTRSKVWRLNYFIKSSSNMWVYPKFVRKIITADIMSEMQFQLISTKTSSLYLESTTNLISYSYHFSLDFKEPVYVTDWIQIELQLQKAWKIQTGFNVKISIQDLEQLVDLEGNIFYSLVYFIKIDNAWIYSWNWQSLDLSHLELNFLNVHGYKYQFFKQTEQWRLSYSFHIGSDIRVTTETDMTTASNLLKQTWCYTLTAFISNCSNIDISPINQVSEISSTGITGWDFIYFVKYNGFIIDVSTWPTFNIKQFLVYYESHTIRNKYKFFLNLDYLYRYFQFKLYLKTKVEKKDYGKIKDAILVSWKKENTEFNSTIGAKVIIDSQKEKVDVHGESTWEIGYHIEVNGSNLRPEATRPTNQTGLQQEINNRVSKGKYEISTTTTSSSLVSTDNFACLVVNSLIQTEDKIKFKDALEMYYRNKTNISSETQVAVIIGPIKQVITSEGHLAWKLSYHISVNGSSMSVESLNKQIDLAHLKEFLNIKTKYGKEVKLVTSSSTQQTDSLFVVSLSHKVTKIEMTKVIAGLKKSFEEVNSVYKNCSCLDIKLWNQHEQISGSGEVSWKLQYAVKVHGRPIDASLVKWPTWQQLKKHLNFITKAGYTIGVKDTTNVKLTSTSLLHSLYFSSYVAKSSYTEIKTKLMSTWTAILDKLGIRGDLIFHFLRNSEWSSSTGKSLWKLDYEVMINATRLDKSTLSVSLQHFKNLQQVISAIKTPSGLSYQLVDISTVILREYAMHFPLYFTSKVAMSSIQVMKNFLHKSWSSHWNDTFLNQTQVEINEHKVLIDMEGNFVYQLVYYLKHNGEIVDSRLLNSDIITKYIAQHLVVTNPRGQLYKVVTDFSQLIREEILFSAVVNHPLTTSTKLQFISWLQYVLERNMQGQNISVGVLQQEELMTESSTSVWKAKFYFKLNGEYAMPIAINGLSTPELYTAFHASNMTVDFKLVQITQDKKLYSYEDRFVVFFNHNISDLYWPFMEDILNKTWSQNTEYVTCGCLKVVVKGIQEVVDIMGITRFKLIYFLSKSEMTVNSQTSVDIDYQLLQKNLIGSVDLQGKPFELVKIIEYESTRIDSMLTVYLNRGVRLDHKMATEAAILNLLNSTNENCCTDVELLRQMEFITSKSVTIWKLDFSVKSMNQTLDMKRLDNLNATTLQETINETITSTGYEILSNEMILDYRQSYSLYLTTPVRISDLGKFQNAVFNYIRQSVSIKINVSIVIPRVTEVIDNQGVTYHKLAVFIYLNGNPVYPRRGAVIDIKQLQLEINLLGIKSAKGEYILVERTNRLEEDKQYTYGLEYFVNKPVKKRDFHEFEKALEKVWMIQFAYLKLHYGIKIAIRLQEEYTNINGVSVFKLVYYLQTFAQNTYKTELPSDQLPALSEDKLEKVLLFLSLHNGYKMASSTDLYHYTSMFTFYLKSPILLPDINQVQERLSERWNSHSNIQNGNVFITYQEEVVDISISFSKVWQVSYVRITNDGKLYNANYQLELSETDYHQALNVNYTTEGDSYTQLMVSRPTVQSHVIRYKETFSVHFSQRVLETQYAEFATALATSWNISKRENVNVTVAGQEEVITQSGKSAYQLFYSVRKEERHIKSLYTDGLNYTELNQNLNIMTSIGTKYSVMEVQSSFKLEEAFQVFVCNAVFRIDRVGFKEAVKEELKTIMPDEDFNNTEVEWRSQTSFLNVNNPTKQIWRQLFVVRRDGMVVSAEKQRKLTNVAVNFNSLAGQNYTVVSTSLQSGYIKEENLFSISVVGRISATLSSLTTIIQTSWTKFDSKWTITLREPEEFIGNSGTVVTQIPYFVTQNTTIAYPDVTRAPEATEIVKTMSTQLQKDYSVYSGQTLVKYNSCFSLSVKRELSLEIKTSEIEIVLKKIWEITTIVKDVVVNIESIENFVGDFGVKINQVLYTVTLNKVSTEPTFDVKPDDHAVQLLLEQELSFRWSIYSGVNTYRLNVLYSIDIAYSSEMTFTSHTRRTVETTLQQIWTTRSNNVCQNCSVSIVDRKEKIGYTMTSNSEKKETWLSKLHYSVQSEGKWLQSYLISPPTAMLVNAALNTSGLSIWNGDTFVTRSVYLEGYSRLEKRQTLVMGLQEAWKSDIESNVEVKITKVQKFVDENWNQLTKVQYVVSVNGTDPLKAEPNSTDVTDAFSKVGQKKKACSCKPLKHHKVFVKAAANKVNYHTVGLAVQAAWIYKNNDSASLKKLLKVRTKNNKLRNKRAANNNATKTKYIGKDGEEITPVDYTLSVDGQEPDPIFLNSPSPSDFDASGLNGCNCIPRKAGTLMLAGNVDDSSSDDVQKAVHDAVVKANPDILPEDLAVDILDISDVRKDPNGNELSEANYAIMRRDNGDIEDVIYPSSAQLDEALKKNGLALYNKTDRTSEEDEEWKIIFGAVCGVVAALIIIALVAYVIVQRKKHKNMDLRKQEEDVANDVYDPENFSGAANYSDLVYETQEAKIDITE